MLFAAISKEFKLVYRDLHSMLVLFAMPAVFIVIMSLALQGQFEAGQTDSMTLLYSVAEESNYSDRLVNTLTDHGQFNLRKVESPATDADEVQTVLGDDGRYYLQVPAGFSDYFSGLTNDLEPIKLWFAPNVDERTRGLIEMGVKAALAKTSLDVVLIEQLEEEEPDVQDLIQVYFTHGEKSSEIKPTSVQQNVPAWLIFSMFFVVIPLSTTLISERQQGTLARLKTMDISMGVFLLVKALPYLLINQLQLVVMLLLGVYLVPILGGDALVVGQHYGALALMSLAVGVAALGYALLVAVVAKTTEQAVSMGGVGNILLGAVGGVMVPKFVMPDYLQQVAALSPMSWALDGFLEIFLYDHGVAQILKPSAILFLFGVILFTVALVIFRRQEQ